MISKISKLILGLVFVSSVVSAQSLEDARKAIDAEQYQKAKSMLKNLTVTQATKDENFFYLGWVYVLQDYTDSAKTAFNKGIAVNPKSALNYAGLGVAAFVDKDKATATTNFNQAVTLAGKNTTAYAYVGRGYLMAPVNDRVAPADAEAAIAILNKAKALNAKDVDVLLALGEAYRTQSKNTEALSNYQAALSINPKLASAKVATGVIWKFANNFESSETEFKAALAIDPNYGPAYREWAETDVRWALSDPKMASVKIKEAVDQYRKYLSLTDMSEESQLRYADFLVYAGDWKTLQTVATDLSKTSKNLKVYRYLAYAAYENKDYPTALSAMNTWITKAEPKRVIARDYLYYGRAQIASQQDSLGIASLQQAYQLDTTQADVYSEMAKSFYAQKKYEKAGDAYHMYLTKSRKGTLNDYFRQGFSYYFAYDPSKPNPDTTLLTKADSAFSYVEQKASKPIGDVTLYRARIAEYKDKDRNNIKGLAKPFYEKYITIMTAAPLPDERSKKNMGEAYAYLGAYYEFKEKDEAKATENYTKAKEVDPTNKQALGYFSKKGGAKGK
ncbi:tetratricopeptide repeat protein [Mucilaginibacter pedocola]|nr:tetratricopeptide repeat protein [Mucilaginibacter pedocola]